MNVLQSLILNNNGYKVKYYTFNPAECPAVINFEQYLTQSKILHINTQTHLHSNLFKKYIHLLISGFHHASLLSVTFINQLRHSVITIIDVKILLRKSSSQSDATYTHTTGPEYATKHRPCT